MKTNYKNFQIRPWEEHDREEAAEIIRRVLAEYGLPWEPSGADRDVFQVEDCYIAVGGEFWVIEQQGKLVGTSAYYPVERGEKAVEIRKMYLLSAVRGKGLGRYLLQELEKAICFAAALTLSLLVVSRKFGLKPLVSSRKRSSYTKAVVTNPQRVWRQNDAIAFMLSH